MLETAATGKLRVFGSGRNRVCFTHVDNYCHGLILAERALFRDSPALGQFYICTDAATHTFPAGYCEFWRELDKAVVGVGFQSLFSKFHLPWLLMVCLGYVCGFIGVLLGKKLKLNPFTVKMLTMNRWFAFDRAERDLGYKPIIGFKEGWADTIDWFRTQWLPNYLNHEKSGKASGYGQIYNGSQHKIDMQNKERPSM